MHNLRSYRDYLDSYVGSFACLGQTQKKKINGALQILNFMYKLLVETKTIIAGEYDSDFCT